MKIAVVCGHFLPHLGYIEVHLAKALMREGHRVLVITSDAVPAYVGSLPRDGMEMEGVETVRLPKMFSLGQIVVSREIRKELRGFDPDFVIAVGLGKRFVWPVFDEKYPVLVLYGDNAYSHAQGGAFAKFKSRVLYYLFKRSVYRRAVGKAAIHVAYTPESFDVAGRALGGRAGEFLSRRDRFIHLGYWPDEFRYDENLRNQKREELGFDRDDVVVVTCGRISREKDLGSVVPILGALPSNYKWLIVGGGDPAILADLDNALKAELEPDRYRRTGHRSRSQLNAYYCAGDIGLFTVPAISNIEAAGTGLPLILPPTGSLSALREWGFCRGDWAGENEDKADAIRHADVNGNERKRLGELAAEKLSWPVQAKTLIGWMVDKLSPEKRTSD